MRMLAELIANMSQASEQGMFAVAGIYVYMILIVGAAFYRIRQFQKESRH